MTRPSCPKSNHSRQGLFQPWQLLDHPCIRSGRLPAKLSQQPLVCGEEGDNGFPEIFSDVLAFVIAGWFGLEFFEVGFCGGLFGKDPAVKGDSRAAVTISIGGSLLIDGVVALSPETGVEFMFW